MSWALWRLRLGCAAACPHTPDPCRRLPGAAGSPRQPALPVPNSVGERRKRLRSADVCKSFAWHDTAAHAHTTCHCWPGLERRVDIDVSACQPVALPGAGWQSVDRSWRTTHGDSRARRNDINPDWNYVPPASFRVAAPDCPARSVDRNGTRRPSPAHAPRPGQQWLAHHQPFRPSIPIRSSPIRSGSAPARPPMASPGRNGTCDRAAGSPWPGCPWCTNGC